ncbi:MAG: hypothetical protein JW820_16815 [Spirochaetales bacterium]|nr:hypothetical protein [Spirochaetales bacterium]
MNANGQKIWVFADGDLPPAGDHEPFGHEALMVVNLNKKVASLRMDILFEDKEPIRDIRASVQGERVHCFRLDKPLGEQGYRIPQGQYALVLRSDLPVVAVFGRLDVRQNNLAYYSVAGYSFS